MEILLFILFVFLSLFSIFGYGKIFETVFIDKKKDLTIGLTGFLGLFLLSVISYFTHIFTSHHYIHNSLFFIIGVSSFLLFLKNGRIKIKKYHCIILFLLIIGIFLAKSHDDFSYYHLPNALHFVENKLEFGLGNLNHGFKHHSSVFYLYSIFFLPFIDFYLFNVLNFFFLLFSVIYLFESVKDDIDSKKFDNISLIKVVFLILFISLFNRIGEYGTDITGQLLAGVLICITLEAVFRSQIKIHTLLIVLSIVTYLITIKTYFIVYIFFLLVLILAAEKDQILKKIIFTKLFLFVTFVATLFTIINISSTGCIIYPVSKLCFPNYFSWGLRLETVNYLSNWYEIWSKAGAGPNFRVEDPLIYIQKLNWLNNWIDKYFFTKVSDFLFAVFMCILIVSVIFRENIKLNFQSSFKKNVLLYILIFLLFIMWFLKFPSLRYGGYVLCISLIIIPFCFLFNFEKVNHQKILKNFTILFSISIFIFFSRNLLRIHKEFNYSAVENFQSFPFFYVKKTNYEQTIINDEKIYKVIGSSCWATPSPCLSNTNKTIKRKYNYRIFLNEQKKK